MIRRRLARNAGFSLFPGDMPIADALPMRCRRDGSPPCAAGTFVMHAGYDRPLAKSEFFIAVSAVYKMIGTLDDFGFIITGDKEFPVGIDRIVSDTFFLSHRF